MVSSIYAMPCVCKPWAGLLGPGAQQLWKMSQMSRARERGEMSHRINLWGRELYTGC